MGQVQAERDVCWLQWFNLSDPQAEDAIYDSESMRRFARVELGEDNVPDESTILRFRHLLEKHWLTESIFEAIKDLLESHPLFLRAGTIVDVTIIAAPSSTKNVTKSRDPEMKQTGKGKNWHFGMKFHIGTDRRGIVHSLRATHAAEADIKQLPNLLRGDERVLYGDSPTGKKSRFKDAPMCASIPIKTRCFGPSRRSSSPEGKEPGSARRLPGSRSQAGFRTSSSPNPP
jgi:IS5 family transposase